MNEIQKIIKFNNLDEEYKEFSSLYKFEIIMYGKSYPSVEHYLRCRKYNYDNCDHKNLEYTELIRNSDNIDEYKDIEKDLTPDPNWENINKKSGIRKKEYIMFECLNEKFKNERLNKLLLSTKGHSLIYENNDEFWGSGENGNGKNVLGKILMSIRHEYI